MADTKDKVPGNVADTSGKGSGMSGTAGSRAGAPAATAGGAMEAVKEKVQDVAAGASELATKAKDTVQDWASSVGTAAVHAKDRAQDVAAGAVDKVGDVAEDVTAMIRRYPVAALLVAFGIGFLGARLLRRV